MAANETPEHYVEGVNRAIDHILAHLDEPLNLDRVAAVAHFSPYHFHRIFRSLVGEPLTAFVTRVRLERALRMLAHDPRTNLTRIALACGFGSSSNFSRVFKRHYGVAPSRFDLAELRDRRRAELQRAIEDPEARHLLDRCPPGENPDGFAVRFRDRPPRTVAYIRVLDPYRPDRVTDAAARLVAWAEARDVADGEWLGYMWDDPDIVAPADCRYDVGVVVPDVEPRGAVGRMAFDAMRVAEVEIRGAIDLEQRALDWLYGTWLPASGYVPDDLPCFESWIGRPFAHGFEHFELRVQLPVVRPGR